MHEIVKDAKGEVTKMRGEYNAQGDPKTTDKKLTWLADVVSPSLKTRKKDALLDTMSR